MIKLNDNYRSIYTRIEELESHFLDCKKPLDSEAYGDILPHLKRWGFLSYKSEQSVLVR